MFQVLLRLLLFAEAVENPQAKGHKLSTVHRPPCISSWISSGHDLGKIPPAVRPLDGFIRAFETWYRTLQPSSCNWPLGSAYPPLSGPDKLEEWGELRKAGPNGTFLVLLALSWISDVADTPEQLAHLEGLTIHIAFVVKRVSSLALSAKAAMKDNKAITPGSKKRKADSDGTTPGKKKLKR
jgi:hypothetical protein